MNIQAFGPNFQSRRTPAVMDGFVALDNNQLAQLAALKTETEFDSKKAKKVSNALFYSAPAAAGLGAALLSNGTKMFSKNLTGVAGRLGSGLKVAAGFAAVLGTVDLLGLAANKITQKSKKAKEFTKEHPFMTMAGLITAAFGTIFLMNKGMARLGKIKAPKVIAEATEKFANKVNNNKFVNKMLSGLKKLAGKTPSTLKEIGASVLDFAPTGLLLGGLLNSVNSSARKQKLFAENYTNLQNLQNEMTKEKMAQLEFENDYLKTDPQNREELEIISNV